MQGVEFNITRLLKEISVGVRSWWEEKGYYTVKDVRYTPEGEMLFYLGMDMDTRRCREEKCKYVKNLNKEKYDLKEVQFGNNMFKDTDNNREKIRLMVKDRYPTSTIDKYETYPFRHMSGRYIQGIEVRIKDIEDIIGQRGELMQVICVESVVENTGLKTLNQTIFTRWKEYRLYKRMREGLYNEEGDYTKVIVTVNDIGNEFEVATENNKDFFEKHFKKIGEVEYGF